MVQHGKKLGGGGSGAGVTILTTGTADIPYGGIVRVGVGLNAQYFINIDVADQTVTYDTDDDTTAAAIAALGEFQPLTPNGVVDHGITDVPFTWATLPDGETPADVTGGPVDNRFYVNDDGLPAVTPAQARRELDVARVTFVEGGETKDVTDVQLSEGVLTLTATDNDTDVLTPIVRITGTPADVPPRALAVVSEDIQYYNISNMPQDGVSTATDFAGDANVWLRVGRDATFVDHGGNTRNLVSVRFNTAGNVMTLVDGSDPANTRTFNGRVALGTVNDEATLELSGLGLLSGRNEARGVVTATYDNSIFPDGIIHEGNMVSFEERLYRWEGGDTPVLSQTAWDMHRPTVDDDWVVQTGAGGGGGAAGPVSRVSVNSSLTMNPNTLYFIDNGQYNRTLTLPEIVTEDAEAGQCVLGDSVYVSLRNNATGAVGFEFNRIVTNPANTGLSIQGQVVGEDLELDNLTAGFRMVAFNTTTPGWLVIAQH